MYACMGMHRYMIDRLNKTQYGKRQKRKDFKKEMERQ